jgi:hypothetical protein
MAKYKRAEEADDTMSYSEEMNQSQQAPVQQQAQGDSDESTYKKRYGDLRRHTQQQLQTKEQELAQLREQLEVASRKQIKFPKTDEEIAEWATKYPDVAKIIDTIAQKRAQEALSEGERRMQGLVNLEQKMNKKEAEQALLALHPDFPQIRQRRDFHEWVQDQPKYIQDALYKNSTDATAAGRAIDLYKADLSKKAKNNPTGAAQSVKSGSTANVGTGTKGSFTESQVAKMSDAEYEKNEEAILASMHSGKFVYDITGAAR